MARVSDWRRVAAWSLESGRGSHRAQLPRLCPDPWPGQMFRPMLRRQLVFSISDLHVQCVLRVLNVKYMINTCSKSALCEIKGRVVARLLIYWPNQTRCCQAANDLLTIVRVINNPSLMFNARNSDKLYLALFSVMRHNTKTFVLSLPRSQWCSAKSAVPRRHHITSHRQWWLQRHKLFVIVTPLLGWHTRWRPCIMIMKYLVISAPTSDRHKHS